MHVQCSVVQYRAGQQPNAAVYCISAAVVASLQAGAAELLEKTAKVVSEYTNQDTSQYCARAGRGGAVWGAAGAVPMPVRCGASAVQCRAIVCTAVWCGQTPLQLGFYGSEGNSSHLPGVCLSRFCKRMTGDCSRIAEGSEAPARPLMFMRCKAPGNTTCCCIRQLLMCFCVHGAVVQVTIRLQVTGSSATLP